MVGGWVDLSTQQLPEVDPLRASNHSRRRVATWHLYDSKKPSEISRRNDELNTGAICIHQKISLIRKPHPAENVTRSHRLPHVAQCINVFWLTVDWSEKFSGQTNKQTNAETGSRGVDLSDCHGRQSKLLLRGEILSGDTPDIDPMKAESPS